MTTGTKLFNMMRFQVGKFFKGKTKSHLKFHS